MIISCWSCVELSGWHELQHPYFYFSLYLKGTYERNLMLAGSETHKHSVNKLDPERFPCFFLKHQENQRHWVIGNSYRDFIFLFSLGFAPGLAFPNLNTWQGR